MKYSRVQHRELSSFMWNVGSAGRGGTGRRPKTRSTIYRSRQSGDVSSVRYTVSKEQVSSTPSGGRLLQFKLQINLTALEFHVSTVLNIVLGDTGSEGLCRAPPPAGTVVQPLYIIAVMVVCCRLRV
ncbi:hypothetical protein E2C01_045150 [Portunus trituberculatus]|uniref:Uncharacterized protein n=1 Tax=Portunus trituberculatus TaxID=210409 RepID=A0A5B7G172_PORTR|nr:hypothetical protein [Portunus trituberculatus]